MMRKLFITLLVAVGFIACREQPAMDLATVHGNVPGMIGYTIYLEELEPINTILLDSAVVDEGGRFTFEVPTQEPSFFMLRGPGNSNMVLLLEPNQVVSIADSTETFGSGATVEGSPGSIKIQDFEVFMEYQKKRVNRLAEEYYKARGMEDYPQKKKALDSIYQGYVNDQRAWVFQSIDENPGSLANLLFINRKLGLTGVIDELEDFAYLYKIDSALQQQYPDNKHSKDHHERVSELKGEIFDNYVREEKLQPGRKSPDVVLNDTAGNPVSLKSYSGKKVLLYFWAGWNALSRKDNRRLTRIYPQLQDQGVEILGISLDENRVVWVGAIRLDDLSWPQVSDLKGFYSEAKKDFNVPDELPFYYLLDEKHTIVYKHHQLDSLLVQLK